MPSRVIICSANRAVLRERRYCCVAPGGWGGFKEEQFFPFSCCLKRFCRVCLSHRGLPGRVSESTIARPREKKRSSQLSHSSSHSPAILLFRIIGPPSAAPIVCGHSTTPGHRFFNSAAYLASLKFPLSATGQPAPAVPFSGLFWRPPRCPPGAPTDALMNRRGQSGDLGPTRLTGSVCLPANGHAESWSCWSANSSCSN
jgi:hypothetical protein